MGPYIIHQLLSRGFVQLAMLDGEEMPNWISGCCIKKYEEPLITNMLERMDNKEKRRAVVHVDRDRAQAEAKDII